MPSAEFERFRFSFFEDPDSARQGLDTPALSRLAGGERAEAEDMLIRYLPDVRGIIGLGILRSRRAEALLVRSFEAERRARVAGLASDSGWSPYRLIALARALWQIRPDPLWSAAVIDVLASAEEPMQRMTAVEALHDIRDPEAAHALATALDDPEALVRHHAARGLLAMHGLPAESEDSGHMIYRVMAKDAARRDGGKSDVLAAIAGQPILPP